MELFRRRPLCLFCLLFILTSLFATWISGKWFPLILILAFVLLFIGILCYVSWRRFRNRILAFILGGIIIAFALLHSFFTIKLPNDQAREYEGEHIVFCQVISKEYESEWGTEYFVKIKQIDEESVDFRAIMEFGFQADVSPGDVVGTTARLEHVVEENYNSQGAVLCVYAEDAQTVTVQKLSEHISILETLFSDSGVQIVSARLRQFLGDRLEHMLGEEMGALAKGFFMGERSDISAEVTRDFRRSGTSHQMAVSGLHISVLLGSIDFLLRKIYVSKRIRCVTVTLLSGIFLMLTGFSGSACRSVLMLLSVYATYWMHEENDSVTSLFASMAVIIGISPYAVSDLGLWMSFLATLGLVSIYPLCENAIPFPKKKNKAFRGILRFIRRIALGALMTIIANLFLLPISAYFFQEFSIVSVASNIVLSPLCYLFLIGVPVLLLVGWIPWVGSLAEWTVSFLGGCILKVVRFFSTLPDATLSLKYGFAAVIVLILTVAMVVLLIVRIKRKWILAIPPALAVVSFCICLFLYHAINGSPTVTYRIDEKQNELFTIRDGSTVSFCDVSYGTRDLYYAMMEELDDSVATEIDTVLLTHYHDEQIRTMDSCMRRTYIRALYLPTPTDSYEAAFANKLWDIAVQCGTAVHFYDRDDTVDLTKSVRVKPDTVMAAESKTLAISVYSYESMITYITPAVLQTDIHEAFEARLRQSSTVLIGSHGLRTAESVWWDRETTDISQDIIYTSDLVRKSDSTEEPAHIREYYPHSDNPSYRITVSLP